MNKATFWKSAIASLFLGGALTPATFAVDPQIEQNQPRVEVEVRRAASPAGLPVRSSTLTGTAVKNAAGEDLGSINDLVVDLETGKIRYLAVSYGGFLGLGDKLFAVPLGASQMMKGDDGRLAHLVLNIDQSKLKDAPGFDKDAWPNFADSAWTSSVDEFYRSPQRDREVR